VRASSSSLYIPALGLVFSAVVIGVLAPVYHLPMRVVGVVILVLLFAAILSILRRRSGTTAVPRPWLFLAVGGIFLIGGVLGLMRSVRENWEWAERLPLAVPVGLGLYLIWITSKLKKVTQQQQTGGSSNQNHASKS